MQALKTRLPSKRDNVLVRAFRKLALGGKPAEKFRIKCDYVWLDLVLQLAPLAKLHSVGE